MGEGSSGISVGTFGLIHADSPLKLAPRRPDGKTEILVEDDFKEKVDS
jgi:hypothetical protein